MKKIDNKHYLWAEKYRPQLVEDLIVPQELKKQMVKWLEDGQIPNLGIWGSIAGTGKTSTTHAILKELDADYLWINASGEGGIDTMRDTIPSFAEKVSVDGRPKIVVLDEADNLTAVQGGAQFNLRGSIEKYAKNCRFILTGNYKEKVIDPIRNRLINLEFDDYVQKYKKEYGKEILNRLKYILDNEGVVYSPKDLAPIITNAYPSIREMTVLLQKLSVEVDGQLTLVVDDEMLETSQIMKKLADTILSDGNDNPETKFSQARKIVAEIGDADAFYTYMWRHIDTYVHEADIPQFVIELSEFQDKSLRARDKSVTLAAFCATVILKQNMKKRG